ncbi:DUF5696 domain-containing protein [Globicatella sulfidifaciens]|uniref:Uncharacterized protein n=1 Tax=Globicatella sulfidifaciens TaxID=136093 RepID=A0A7X8C5Q8_9LACT|nr:DUF5696 domain-containing protein [Globicatella sulfidifaciens]NLJ19490.1 hypothetical protein [Globicatella sulfidifaciens]
MVKRLLKLGIALIIIISIVGFFLINNREEPKSVTVAQSNHQAIVVNDQNPGCRVSKGSTDIPEDFDKVAENEQLELFVEEETVAILIRDKCNDYVWSSYDVDRDLASEGYSQEMINYMRSGVSIITYDRFTPGRRTLLDSGVEKTYHEETDGFRVTVDFTLQQIKFDLIVTLQGGDLLIHVPMESVEEYNPNLWEPGNNNISLSELIVYPFLGSTDGEETGYVVIPDGPGAIVNLDEVAKSTAGYSGGVYGRDYGYENNPTPRMFSVKPPEQISLPIYGFIHEEGQVGLLAISEHGESYATYNYRPKDTDTNYYQSYFTYNYRTAYSQFQSRVNEEQHVLGFQEKPNKFDLVQRYVFLRGEEADYVGVAKAYRDFLEKNSDFVESREQSDASIPMKIDFINNEVRMGTLGIEEVVLTEYNQAIDIVKDLKELDYHNLNVTFKTFLTDNWIYGIDIFRNLGGKGDFEEALSYFSDNNVAFNYYADYTRSYHSKTKYTGNKMNRNDFIVFNRENETMNYMNHPKFYQVFADEDLDTLQSLNIDAVALDGLGSNLFTHFDNGHVRSSVEGMAYTEALLQYFHEHEIKTSMYAPNAYLYPYLEAYFDTPIHSSGLSFADETVPLIQLILSGRVDMYSPYLNTSSNDQDTILNLIEYGVFPAFILTGESTYHLKETASSNIPVSELRYLEDRIENYYRSVNEALSEVLNSEMIDHQIIDEGVAEVTYSNGKVILVNYNSSDYNYEGIKIEAKGFVMR